MEFNERVHAYIAAKYYVHLTEHFGERGKKAFLHGLDTEGVEPMSHVFPVHNVFLEDVVTNGYSLDGNLANAPAQKDDAFKVPKTVE